MTEQLVALLPWKGAALLAWFALFFLAERLRPLATPRGGAPRVARNLGLFAPVVVLSAALVAPLTVWAAGQAWDWRPAWWAGGLGLVLDLLLLDALIYAWHRANHTVPFLWRFHEVHHRDAFLDSSSALRFHVGEVFLSAVVRLGLVLLLGFPLLSVAIFETLVLAAAIFHHSNLRLPPRLERALSWVVVTPSIHWVHHHATRQDTDSNYATILSLWDRLFASRSATRRVPDMAIGCQGRSEGSLLQLLAAPFRRQG